MIQYRSRNVYGDNLTESASNGRGVDIASQRLDDLDKYALEALREIPRIPAIVADLGCGKGSMAKAFTCAGAEAYAFDAHDFSAEFNNTGIHFILGNLLETLPALQFRFDLILFQRTLHYFTYHEAKILLGIIWEKLVPRRKVFISMSGLTSELGNGYVARDLPIEARFHPLSVEMSSKHQILSKVCLYSLSDGIRILEDTGFNIISAYESEFRNIKIIAEKR